MMLVVAVLAIGCCAMMSSGIAGVVAMRNPDLLKGAGSGASGTAQSPTYGGGGGQYQGTFTCPDGQFVTALDIDLDGVGPAGKKSARVQGFQVSCNKGAKQTIGQLENNQNNWHNTSCASGMSGVNVWDNGKIIQRLQPMCANGKPGEGHGASIGNMNTWSCGAGQKVVGVSGRYGADFDSVSFLCKDFAKK